jgi:DMSO reductase anchor subunit
MRFTLLSSGLLLLAVAEQQWAHIVGALLVVAGEFVGRYLFFVSVVPTNMAAGFPMREAA